MKRSNAGKIENVDAILDSNLRVDGIKWVLNVKVEALPGY